VQPQGHAGGSGTVRAEAESVALNTTTIRRQRGSSPVPSRHITMTPGAPAGNDTRLLHLFGGGQPEDR
jgi:hypothetical protein